MSFAKYMKQIRKEKNLSQVKMAETLDISVTALKLIETGSTKFPGEKVLNNLCALMNYEKIDAITNILFTDEELEIDSTRYTACRYLAYLYLEGWNIEKSPYKHSIWSKRSVEFDAKVSKKRDKKNIVLVSSYDRFTNGKPIKNEDDILMFISNIASSAITILSPFRAIQVVFNAYTDEIYMYDRFKDEMVAHIDFDIDIIIFNPRRGILIETKHIKRY